MATHCLLKEFWPSVGRLLMRLWCARCMSVCVSLSVCLSRSLAMSLCRSMYPSLSVSLKLLALSLPLIVPIPVGPLSLHPVFAFAGDGYSASSFCSNVSR